MAKLDAGALLLSAATLVALGLGVGMTNQSVQPAPTAGAIALPPVPAALGLAPNAPETDTASLNEAIRTFILQNPEVLVEAFGVLEERQLLSEAQADFERVRANADALWNDPNSWVGGNPDGAITIVEFVDYKCGFCKRAKPEVDALVAANADVRIIRKEFPILGAESLLATRAALSVLQNDGDAAYQSFSDSLMSFNGPITENVLTRFAQRAGADPDAMLSGMESVEINRQIQANRALGQRLGISGTPTFVFGERLVRGFLPREQMEQTLALLRDLNN